MELYPLTFDEYVLQHYEIRNETPVERIVGTVLLVEDVVYGAVHELAVAFPLPKTIRHVCLPSRVQSRS